MDQLYVTMADTLEDFMNEPVLSESEDDTINITQQDIDDINKDIVEEPPTKEDIVEQSSAEQLKALMQLMQNMDDGQRNKILSSLAEKNNLNLENTDYDERSKKNFLKMQIKNKLREKANGRKNKEARLKYAEQAQDRMINAPKKDKVSEEEIEVSAKTLKNRKKKLRRKAKKAEQSGMSSDDDTEANDAQDDQLSDDESTTKSADDSANTHVVET